MVQINFAGKEIMTKVVYYGPALCGKTTNLQKLHVLTDPDGTTKLFSINTDKDRTLFFDLLPLNVGKIHGYTIKLQVFTVPGQVNYSSTRRAVLSGADAVVFVADSQEKMLDANIESMRDLGVNLELNGFDIENIPLVLQYNKRDLKEISSITELENVLNDSNRKSFEASAVNSRGVLETFIAVVQVMMARIVEKYRLDRGNRNADFTRQLVTALERFKDRDIEDTNPVDMRRLLLTFEQPSSRRVPDWGGNSEDSSGQETLPGAMSNNELIERAVSANMELANIYVQLDETKKSVEIKVRQLQAVTRIGEAITSLLDLDKLLKSVGKQLSAHQGDAVCIGLVEGKPLDLKPRSSLQLKTDPIFQVRAEKGKSLAHLLAHQRRPVIVSADNNPQWFKLIQARFPTVYGLISVPLLSHRRLLGLVNIITMDPQRDFDNEDIQFYSATSKFLSSAIENARLYGMISLLNRNLETKVEEIRRLNDDRGQSVQQKTQELTQANEALKKANALLSRRFNQKKELFHALSQLVPSALVLTHDFLGKEHGENTETTVYKYLMVCLNSYFQIHNGSEGTETGLNPRLMDLSRSMLQVIRLNKSLLRDKKIRALTRLDKTLPFQTDPKVIRLAFSLVFIYGVTYAREESEFRVWGEVNRDRLGLFIRILSSTETANSILDDYRHAMEPGEPRLGRLIFKLAETLMILSGGTFEIALNPIAKKNPGQSPEQVPDGPEDENTYVISKFLFNRGSKAGS